VFIGVVALLFDDDKERERKEQQKLDAECT
jgi:hypothetical protein